LIPSTVSLELAHARRVVHSPLRSALRFSQPFSGFLAGSSFAALFRATTVPGIPLQSFPLTEIAHPSRGHMLPCSYPPPCRDAPPDFLSPPISPTSAHECSCPVPLGGYGSPFRAPEGHFPVSLDLRQQIRHIPPASPTSKPYSSCESVHVRPSGPGPTVDTLLGFLLSEAFSSPASDPQTRSD
jgi:hypothetical protein